MSEQTPEAYPRPQLRRDSWTSLDGQWDFAFDLNHSFSDPQKVPWSTQIQVPFSPETAASGVGRTDLFRTVWYRRRFSSPILAPGQRLVLHFEAVDYTADVWVNNVKMVRHHGAYTPFHTDVTDALRGGEEEVIVRADDDPADLAKPRGKQDWKLEAHSIWYPRTTGIWQTVWIEVVSAVRIERLSWTSNLHRWEIGLEAVVTDNTIGQLQLGVVLKAGETILAEDRYSVISGEVHRQIALSDPGIDDFRNDLLWSPDSPTIIDATLELRDHEGQLLDTVTSYTALRAISLEGNRFVLNGRPFPLRLVLDQGYWPETGLTAPNDEALLQDVVLAKKLGFNGVRKHQKIESQRYLYWADKMGLLVWEEMPSAYRYTRRTIERVTSEWVQILKRDISHPCIVAWVPINESWGVPDLPDSPAQRDYVQALYHLTKSLDPTRPVIGNDGWESVATDILGIHDYDAQPERIGRRYGQVDVESRLLQRERPGGRMLLIDPKTDAYQPIVLSEFGGIALTKEEGAWGYARAHTPEQLLASYTALLEVVRSLSALAGFCYTQFADTYQEANGLLYADRRPKVPLDQIAAATAGPDYHYDAVENSYWRDCVIERQR